MHFEWRHLDFVGHLERLAADWALLGAKVSVPPHDKLLLKSAQHATSTDPLGVRAQLRMLLASRPALRRALCVLLEPDYRCFDYNRSSCAEGTLLLSEQRSR